MAHLFDPALLAGLLTLVVLEIVLGIDNLVFVAILSDKLDPSQRDKARTIGLSLALVLRLGLLAGISWIVGLTTPLVTLRYGPQRFQCAVRSRASSRRCRSAAEGNEPVRAFVMVDDPIA